MELSAKGAAFLRHHEGFVDHYYLDPVGVGTMGIGFTWKSDAFKAWWDLHRPGEAFGPGARISADEAEAALREVVDAEYGAAVNAFLGKRKVDQTVFDGMASVVFNLGAGALKWKWAAAIARGDLTAAAQLLKNTGTTAKGKTLPGLITRRREEAELIALGDYTVGKVYADAPTVDDGVLERGERNDAVREIQGYLIDLGLYHGEIDGLFGHGTEAAVLAFQKDRGLDVDGKVGPKTLDAIREAAWAKVVEEDPSAAVPAPAPAAPVPPPPPPDRDAMLHPPATPLNWGKVAALLAVVAIAGVAFAILT